MIAAVIWLTSCGSGQEPTLEAEPDWIQSVPRTLPARSGFSFTLSGEVFWSAGYEKDDILDWVDEHMMLSVNSELISTRDIVVDRLSLELPVEVFDDQQNRLGSYPDVIEVFFPPPISDGTFRINLSIPSTSGEVYSYSWDLVVVDD